MQAGAGRPKEQDPIRPVFQRDRDRVLHCKAFRRLKQKTQVFLSRRATLTKNGLTHTLEVSQIARTIARALRLNEDLTEAISLAHDLGHTPSATPESGRWISSRPAASSTICRACGWWTSSRRTGRAST